MSSSLGVSLLLPSIIIPPCLSIKPQLPTASKSTLSSSTLTSIFLFNCSMSTVLIHPRLFTIRAWFTRLTSANSFFNLPPFQLSDNTPLDLVFFPYPPPSAFTFKWALPGLQPGGDCPFTLHLLDGAPSLLIPLLFTQFACSQLFLISMSSGNPNKGD